MRHEYQVTLLVLAGVASLAMGPQDWPMWGGTAQRNMTSAMKGLPESWDAKDGTNIKWKAQLGSTSNGNPVVADGKIFLGTNNGNPRNPEITGDKGVLMCFRESDGQFLWQAVTDKLESGGQRLARRGRLLVARGRRASGSTTSATAANSSAWTPKASRTARTTAPSRTRSTRGRPTPTSSGSSTCGRTWASSQLFMASLVAGRLGRPRVRRDLQRPRQRRREGPRAEGARASSR